MMRAVAVAGLLAVASAIPGTPTNGKFCAPDKFQGEYVLATKDYAAVGNITFDYLGGTFAMYENGVNQDAVNVRGTYYSKGIHGYWVDSQGGKTTCFKFRQDDHISENRCNPYIYTSPVEIGGQNGRLLRNLQKNSTGGIASYSATVTLQGDIVSYTNFTLSTPSAPGFLTTLKYFNTSTTINPGSLVLPPQCIESPEEVDMHPHCGIHHKVKNTHRFELFGRLMGQW